MSDVNGLLKLVIEGDADFILCHNFKSRAAPSSTGDAISHKASLVKFNEKTRAFDIVEGVHFKVLSTLTAAGMLQERPFDSYGLYTCLEVVSSPRYDLHLAKYGECFDVNRTPISASWGAIKEVASEFGFTVESIPSIKAFKLVKLESNTIKKEMKDPFIHGVYRVSDLDIAGWKVAIINTLIREGFYRVRKSRSTA